MIRVLTCAVLLALCAFLAPAAEDAPIIPKQGFLKRLFCKHHYQALGRGLWLVCHKCGATRPLPKQRS